MPVDVKDEPYCKRLWLAISGTTCRCAPGLISYEINNAMDLLKNGLNYYKKFTSESLPEVEKTCPIPAVYNLISILAPLLNLDAKIAYELTANYMVYEYRNCDDTFATELSDSSSKKHIVEEIWNFYYSERITMLKCLKLIIEYRDNSNHPYYNEFSKFIEINPLNNLLESLLKQIDNLKSANINERSHLLTDEHLHKLYNNNLNEMRELLLIITMIIDTIRPDDFEKIYGSICGEPRRLSSSKNHEDKEMIARKLEELRKCQSALFIVTMDVKKHCENVDDMSKIENWIGIVRSGMQDTLEHKCLRDNSIEDGPLLLSWMIANYAIESENPDVLNLYRPFGLKAVQLDVFKTLETLLKSEMFRGDTRYAQIVRSSIYNLLSLLCGFIDVDKLCKFNGIFEAVSAVLSSPELAAEFWNDKTEENDLWPFYNHAVFLFPHRFEPLTIIATGLASASVMSAKKISEKLENLPTIMIKVPSQRNNLMTIIDGKKIYRPYEKDCTLHHNNFGIPDDCPKVILDSDMNNTEEIILWKINGRYGDAFHHKIEQFFSRAGAGLNTVGNEEIILLDNVVKGFELLNALLLFSAEIDIQKSMVIPTDYLCFEIINRFSYPVLPKKLYEIVAVCCKITSRLSLQYPNEVFLKMRVGVYPKFNNFYQDTKELARAVSFDGGLIGSWLSGIETIEHKYPILCSYLDTLANFLFVKHSVEMMENVEIPGMVFLLQGVLPKLDSWYFSSESERIDLWLKSMFCIHRVLDANLLKNEPRKKLQLVVAYSLLYLEPRHALLKLIRTGEKILRSKMINEIDWISGEGFKIIKCVQLALSLVNRLLMFRNNLGLTNDERSPLEVALYASPSLPNALLIIPTIVDYLYVEFSPSLQAMAVRLLKKFANDFSMSLLVCMGMDGRSIRGTFASRLIDETCSTDVKVAILELVAVCLERQPGLTEALFNIMHQAEQNRIFPRPLDQFQTEGCSKFLVEYLKRIYNEENIVRDRLYDNTMNLLRAMWYNRNVILVNDFRRKENFWTQLFAPLFRSLIQGSRGYAHLIDIITLELFESSTPENNFTKNLEKLLLKDDYWEKIIQYILASVLKVNNDTTVNKLDALNLNKKNTNDVNNHVEAPLYEANIEAWCNFIVTLSDRKISSELMEKIEPAKIQLMIKLTLETLSARIKATKDINDARIIMLLSSLALRIVSSWQLKCIDNPSNFVSTIVQLMEDIFNFYESYGISLRRILTSLLLGCIQLVKDSIANDRGNLEYLLVHSCLLANSELRKLREIVKKNQQLGFKINPEEEQDVFKGKSIYSLKSYQECTPATLTICIVTQLLRCTNNKNTTKQNASRSACLHLRQMTPELMNCLNETIQHHQYIGFSRSALEFLGTIVRLPYYNPSPRPVDDEESIAKLWLGLVPPSSLGNSMLALLHDNCTNNDNWRCQDWWQIYILGLEFVTGLVTTAFSSDPSTIPTIQLKSIILFLGSHEHQLIEVATLIRHNADLLAIDLVQSLVALISALTTQSQVWEFIQPSVREGLMKCMYLIYDSTVNLLLRPRILKFIIDGISLESAEDLHFCDEKLPSNELKLLVNKLIIVNTWCAQCFVRFSPKLNELVDTISTQDFWHTPLAEINVDPPPMSICSGPSLTFGTIMSSTQLFTQALNSHLCTINIQNSSKKDSMDSAKREWERATPDNPRKINPKDLRTIFNIEKPLNKSLSSFITTGPELLGNPRLLRRPYDPLICENPILSRATPFFIHHTGGGGGGAGGGGRLSTANKNGANQTISSSSSSSSFNKNERTNINPWFSVMNKNNSRIALEINLILLLCQTLEGIKSPRLALRQRQLIARDAANEISVCFDFLEHKAVGLNEWKVEGALLNDNTVTIVEPTNNEELFYSIKARLKDNSTIDKVPVGTIDHDPGEGTSRESLSLRKETRLDDNPITTGCFELPQERIKFLSLVAKTFKSTLESHDSAKFE